MTLCAMNTKNLQLGFFPLDHSLVVLIPERSLRKLISLGLDLECAPRHPIPRQVHLSRQMKEKLRVPAFQYVLKYTKVIHINSQLT